MSSTFIRSLVAFVLIAGSVASLFPPTYAFGNQQSSTEARPRRGKNDSSSSPGKSPGQVDTSKQEDPEGSEGSAPAPPRNSIPPETTKTQRANSAGETQPRDADRWPQADDSQASRSKSSRDVPAFDRPPLGNGKQPQASQGPARRAPQISTQDDGPSAGTSRERGSQQGTPQTPQANSRDGSTGDIDDPNAPRGTQQRPELRRPSDRRQPDPPFETGRQSQRTDTQQRPELRRPSDPPFEAGRQSQRTDTQQQAGRAAQRGQSQPQSGGEDESIKIESTLVNLPLLVSDRSGRFIPQLSKNDFLLYEDGVRQEVASFGSEEVPFSVALLLDVSPSVQGNIPDIQEAALAFVRQLRAHDRVMVVSFDRRAHYLTDFTSDRRTLESAIRSISTGSGTSVYDAVYEAVAQKLRGVEGRKALILFSDGEDTTSNRASYDDAVNIVTESDVLVYGLRYAGSGFAGNIGNPWPRFPNTRTQLPFPLPFPWPFPQGRRRRGPLTADPKGDPSTSNPSTQSRRRGGRGGDFMTDIAAAGGGPVFDAEQVGDMTRLATRIADELRHVYVISYYPTNPLSNGGYRAIRVSVKGRDDIAIRHRRGYNARDARSARPTI